MGRKIVALVIVILLIIAFVRATNTTDYQFVGARIIVGIVLTIGILGALRVMRDKRKNNKKK